METDQLLDLFNISSSSAGDVAPMPSDADDVEQITHANAVDAMGVVKDKRKKTFLDEIGELWDEKQYDEEFDLTSFLESMKG
jgi:TATA-binding protein-associated factor